MLKGSGRESKMMQGELPMEGAAPGEGGLSLRGEIAKMFTIDKEVHPVCARHCTPKTSVRKHLFL